MCFISGKELSGRPASGGHPRIYEEKSRHREDLRRSPLEAHQPIPGPQTHPNPRPRPETHPACGRGRQCSTTAAC